MMVWAIKSKWGYEAVEIVSEAAKTAFYKDRNWGKTRISLDGLLTWRGDEESARRIVAKLTSARAERGRRVQAANDWFAQRQDEILAASGMEAATAGETEGLGLKGDSPTAAPSGGDAHTISGGG